MSCSFADADSAALTLLERAFPRWVAWVSLLLAVWLVIGPIGWLGLLFGVPVWTLLLSVLLWLQAPPAGAGRSETR